MLKCLQIMCAKYYELRYMFYFKKLHSSKVACLLDTASKFALFSVSSLKDKKLIKKQTYTKTETCWVYSRVFWMFLPNIIKIACYNFELYHFKVGAFFLRHSVHFVADLFLSASCLPVIWVQEWFNCVCLIYVSCLWSGEQCYINVS